jgi:hypothetical protein
MMKRYMSDIHLARPYLDSLTTGELTLIADNCGIDIPPNLERIFIIEELLDYARAEEEEEREEEEEDLIETVDYLETAPIPRQYNITFIDVMIRDPLWAFVFWEVKEHDKGVYEKNTDFSGYFLRVNSVGKDGVVLKGQGFTVQVDSNDTARYLGFSEGGPTGEQSSPYPVEGPGGCFQIELCAGLGEGGDVLAVSRIFSLPKLSGRAVLTGASSLAALSGSEDFRILRNADRQPRLRSHGGESG